MKHILITGEHSYIGSALAEFLGQWPEEYAVRFLSLRGDSWRSFDFSGIDAVYHAAGIAHRKETEENAGEYYAVNRDLTIEVAQRAKDAGVKQFLFLSTGSVYGKETGIITKDTPLTPVTHYGRSKAEAEEALQQLRCDSFRVAIIRPLMVYGKGCRGNFQTVLKLVKKSPVFPAVHNRRSLIYIDNLSSFAKLAIDRQLEGVYFPRNKEDADIYAMAQLMARQMGKKLHMSPLLGACIRLVRSRFGITRKAFGDLIYQDTEEFNCEYCVCSFAESIRRSV